MRSNTQWRLRGRAGIALAALVPLAVGGTTAATQAMGGSKGRAKSGRARHGALSVTKAFFGQSVEPYTGKNTAVYRYTLRNARGMSVRILTYGGIVQAINAPDRRGRRADLVLGFPTLQDYVTMDSPPVTANGGS